MPPASALRGIRAGVGAVSVRSAACVAAQALGGNRQRQSSRCLLVAQRSSPVRARRVAAEYRFQRWRLISSRNAFAEEAAATAKSSPDDAYKIAREELTTSPAPSAVFALVTTASTS